MRRSLLFPSVSTAVLIAVVPALTARAHSERALHASTVSGPVQVFGLDSSGACSAENLNPATGRCSVDFFQNDTFSGDLQGQQRNAGALSIQFANDRGDGVSLGTFTGTVRGCPGGGTALFRYVVKVGVDAPGHNTGTVQVVSGSGTGGLRTLKGSGHFEAHVGINGGTSTLVADFSCTDD